MVTPEQRTDVSDALMAYWTSRDEARLNQVERGVLDTGERSGVTSGGHLDRIAQLLGRVCIRAGAPKNEVFYKTPKGDPNKRKNMADGYTLPGYYRPTKQWDLVVTHKGEPIVIVELKSQNGPSYGNNANNRAEEALGNALDLAQARARNLIPGEPWVGYVYVIEDDERSSRGDRGQADRGFHPKDLIFENWSYLDRVRLLCRRLVAEGHYDAAWAVATSRPSCPADGVIEEKKRREKCPQIDADVPDELHNHQFGWFELDIAESGYVHFVTELEAKISQHYPNRNSGGRDSDPLALF
jgi:hypothetical protein